MPNNVYVGNRYVPVFANPVEWDNLRAYEALTIVTYQGTSYTSKKAVPVGVALSNSEYWVVTGNYNQQVEAYRQEVNTLSSNVTSLSSDISDLSDDLTREVNTMNSNVTAISNRTTALENSRELKLSARKFIFVADSYGTYGWTAGVISRLGLNAHALDIGGAGFAAGNGGTTFLQGLTTYANTLSASEKASVTDIIVMGGINDFLKTASEIDTAIGNFVTYAVAQFPNAKIGCGCMSWCNRDNDLEPYVTKVIPAYQKGFSSRAKCYYIPNAYLPMHDYDNIQSDGIHPTTAGTTAIVNWVCDYLLGNDPDYIKLDSADFTFASGKTGVFGMNTQLSKDGVDIIFRGCTVNFSTAVTLDNMSTLISLGTITGGGAHGLTYTGIAAAGVPSIMLTVPCRAIGADFILSGTATVYIYNGNVSVSACITDPALGRVNYATNVLALELGLATAHVSLLQG